MSLSTFPVGLVKADFNYIAVSFTATQDIYIYKDGGASGVVVQTITLTYSDSGTKAVLASVAIS